jgi:polyketide synthase PksN
MHDQFIINNSHPIIKNHKVYGQELLPGLAYIDMLYQFFRENGFDYNSLELRNLSFYNPLVVGRDYHVMLSIHCSESKAGQWQIVVEGREQRNGTLSPNIKRYITAEMHRIEPIVFEETLDLEAMKQSASKTIGLNEFYEQYRRREMVHTGFMKAEGRVYVLDTGILIDISIGQHALPGAARYMFHPTLIDGSGAGSGILLAPLVKDEQQLFLPLFYESFRAAALLQTQCVTRIQTSSLQRKNELLYLTMEFFNEAGKKVGELKNFINKLVREAGLINPNRMTTPRSTTDPASIQPSGTHTKTPIHKPGGAPSDTGPTIKAESFLRQLLADRLKKPVNQIDPQVGYYEMGLDSPGLIEVVQAIETKIGTSLSPTMLFEYTTIAELAGYLTEQYGAQFDPAAAGDREFAQEPPPRMTVPGSPFETRDPITVNSTAAAVPPAQQDIAIIGMAGRYPGARNHREFWTNLKQGKDCINEIPKSRWDWSRFDGIESPSGRKLSKWGGFIDDPACFDPQFFRISPAEAELLDPQERLFLETCWEAIEDAGYTPKTLVPPRGPDRRRHVGVFAGVMHKDYTLVEAEKLSIEQGQVFPITLNYAPIVNRVSYFCNFHGPSMAIDTVCSSSLTALHLALKSIEQGESEVALAGGVNLSLHPYKYMSYGIMGLHSSDGYCHTFGKGSDGYVSGEGIGAVLLKPLQKAIQDHDHIYAVIKGSTINHGGTVSGISVPSPVAQADMIRTCLEKTGINPRTISYIEAHGTGTTLGDPIEIQGLVKAYRHYTRDRQFCAIGSVKSNIGHPEAAAGIAGLSKVALQLYYKTLVPSLHSRELNPYIDFKQSPFYLQHQTETWKQPVIGENHREVVYPRRAGLSSFGATGSNAHVILEEYLPKETMEPSPDIRFTKTNPAIIPLSAKNKERLRDYAGKLLDFLENPDLEKKPRKNEGKDKTGLKEILEAKIRGILSNILHVREEAIETGHEWDEYGVEPFHIIQMKEKIQEELKIEIDGKELDQKSSIASAVAYLIHHHRETLEHHLTSLHTLHKNTPQKETNPGSKEINLAELAYTLQVGREAMENRVIFIVRNTDQLVRKLKAFIAQEQDIDNCFQGEVQRDNEFLDFFTSDEDITEAVGRWTIKGKFTQLAKLWVKGLALDWDILYREAKPRRISLPTYPFTEEPYWVPGPVTITRFDRAAGSAAASIHPLLQQNTADLLEQRFSSTFTGEEFFLADHKVKGYRVLPGVAYLEMARAAVEQAAGALARDQAGIRVKNVVWARPVTVEDKPVRVHIGLFPEDNGEIAFEIYSKPEALDAEPLVHSQGRAVLETADQVTVVPTLDITALKAQCNQAHFSSHQCYQAFRAMGINHGPAHQGVEQIYVGANQILAKLSLPAAVSDTRNQFVLHPSLMDSALQASIGLMIPPGESIPSPGKVTLNPPLPFALQELEIRGNCTPGMWALIRASDGSEGGDSILKLDIDLCDETGKIRVRMKKFSYRFLEGEMGSTGPSTHSGAIGTIMLLPGWKERVIPPQTPAPGYTQHLVLLCELNGVSREFIESNMKGATGQVRCLILQSGQKGIEKRFQTYTLQVFREIRRILTDKPGDKVLVQVVVSNHQEHQLFTGISALLKTARLENPKLIGQLLAVPPGEVPQGVLEKLEENSRCPMDSQVHYQEGKSRVPHWSIVEFSQETENIPHPWKDRGVYLITGGAGGLGLIFAREIARQVKGATLILTGRSRLSRDKQAKLKEIEALSSGTGTRVQYKQVDMSQKKAVVSLIRGAREEFGGLHGIIHSAGVIRDNFIIKKTKEELIEVLAPKVAGLVNLDQASKAQELDFFIFFSSGAGVSGNIGQADYAAANAFMDAYAKYRNQLVAAKQRHGQTLSINWPLWKEGGMHVHEEREKMLKLSMGMVAMETSTGINAFYQALASGKEQVMVIEGDLAQLRAVLLKQQPGIETSKTPDAPGKNKTLPVIPPDSLREKTIDYFKKMLSAATKLPIHKIEADDPLEKYGIDSIMVMYFTNQLEKTFGSLSKTLFFEYQTIRELAGYFLESHRDQLVQLPGIQESAAASPVNTKTPAAVTGPVQSISGNPGRQRFVVPGRESPLEKKTGTLDIAIIGLSGRYPQAKNIREFWENIRTGKDCITEVPEDRWDHSLYFETDRNKPGKTYCKWGGFLEGVDQFDPLFFNISPREANIIDPKERLFLETAWDLLEGAGYTREKLQQTYQARVGVYVGAMYQQYHAFDADMMSESIISLSSYSSIANRVSYFFNFQGPSLALDTACSSSFTAIHMACQSLVKGECQLAIAGGVNLSIHPKKYLGLSLAQMIGSHPNSRSFGDGDGYLPAEAVGAVLLKPLSKAVRDGDSILAVIKSTAANHGGHSNGFSVPNPNAQAQMMENNFRKSGIHPRTISYVEAAANGSALGDPIELTALNKAFKKFTGDQQFCAIGSVKSNIGHSEAASGMSQLTKVVLQLQHQQLVPSIKAEPLNPNLSFNNTPFYLQKELREWKRPVVKINGKEQEFPRRAAINSFGAGGSNGHMIIEEYTPSQEVTVHIGPTTAPRVVVFSAKTPDRLQAVARQMFEFIKLQTHFSLANFAYTLQVGREAMEYRVAMLVRNREELIEALQVYLEPGSIGKETTASIPIFTGNLQEEHSNMKSLLAGKVGETVLQLLLAENDLEKLALHWTQGGKIPWESLYQKEKVQRISLPTYPFARERCWLAPTINQSPPPPKKREEAPRQYISDNTPGYVTDLIKGILGISPGNTINPGKQLTEYGMNSISGIQLYEKLERELGVQLDGRQFFSEFTLQGIVRQIESLDPALPRTSQRETASLLPWVKDKELPGKLISQKKVTPFKHNPSPKNIFLTGVTGLLGAFLCDQILQQTSAALYCLVRAPSKSLAVKRIQDNLKKYKLWKTNYRSRIIPVLGDLTKPRLGIQKTLYNELSRSVQSIYHCGADINHLLNYHALKAANVDGTLSIIEFAGNNRVKPIHFISSYAVCYQANDEALLPFHQLETPLDHGKNLTSGYAQTKWVSEHHLLQAQEQGIPITIFRSGQITVSSQTGLGIADDFFHNFLKIFNEVEAVTRWDERVFHIVPVDYASQAVFAVSQQNNCYGKIYHLTNPNPVPVQDFFDFLQEKNPSLVQISFEEWVDRCLQYISTLPAGTKKTIFMSLFTKQDSGLRTFEYYFHKMGLSHKNIQKALQTTKVKFPKIDVKWWEKCMKQIASFDVA